MEASKNGEWYTVKGRASNGREVSVDIPAPNVDGKSRKEAQELFARSIERMKDHAGS